MAPPAAGSECPAGLPGFPEKRWLTGHLLLFPIASWTTQTKMQNKVFWLTDRTKLELNYNCKISAAEDDVSQRKQELLGSSELVISVCEGRHLSVHLPKKWIPNCNNEKRVSTNVLSISPFVLTVVFQTSSQSQPLSVKQNRNDREQKTYGTCVFLPVQI